MVIEISHAITILTFTSNIIDIQSVLKLTTVTVISQTTWVLCQYYGAQAEVPRSVEMSL